VHLTLTLTLTLQAAFQYIRETWPYFDRTGGRNHLLVVTDDVGGCSLLGDPAAKALLRNVTLLTLFGYHTPNYPCFRPGLDVVIPDMHLTMSHLARDFAREPPEGSLREADYNNKGKGRTLGDRHNRKLHYAGDIWGASAGDANSTEEAWEEHTKGWWNRLDNPRNVPLTLLKSVAPQSAYYRIHDTSDGNSRTWNFWEFQMAKFCVETGGPRSSFPRRITQAIVMGCIPVIIQDNVDMPFEEWLPYDEFSVRVRESDAVNLDGVIKQIKEDQVHAMQVRLPALSTRLR